MRRLVVAGVVASCSAALAVAGSASAATLTVTNTNDSGPGSLRAAIAAANAGPRLDRIVFDPSLRGETIPLTSGELVIRSRLRIIGPGPDADDLTVSGEGESRVFRVTRAANATIALLTVAHGFVGGSAGDDATDQGDPGGAGERGDSARADAGSGSHAVGGGILNVGDLTLGGVLLRDNRVIGGDGGNATATGGDGGNGADGAALGANGRDGGNATATGGDGGSAAGGAVFNRGSLEVVLSTLTDNAAVGGTGGNASATGGDGGAGGDGGLTGGNGGDGGDATATGGDAGSAGGGAIVNVGDELVVRTSTVSGNEAVEGVGGTATAKGGQPGAAGTGVVPGSPGSAGSTTEASGEDGQGTGGGIASARETARLVDATVTANKASGGSNLAGEGGGAITARSTIVSDGEGGENCAGETSSEGYNIDSGESCEFNRATDQESTDPDLAPLEDNGGPTPTHLPGATSPAIDQGAPGGLFIDQRGVLRPIDLPSVEDAAGGDGSDVGAVERRQDESDDSGVRALRTVLSSP